MFQKHKRLLSPFAMACKRLRGRNDRFVSKHKSAPERSVSCAFDLDHYRELLEAAQAGGYRFAFFEGSPRGGRP